MAVQEWIICEMPKVYKIIGPPGCGKTEYLLRQIEKACDKYFSKDLGVVSHTVASVSEAKDRIKKKLNIEWKEIPNVRTVHSHCFDLLRTKKEDVMETAKNIREFNEAYPSYRLTIGLKDEEGQAENSGNNDKVFNQMQILRSQMVPRDQWPLECQHLGNAWFDHMRNEGKIDFCGMLEQCLDRELSPDIKVLMVDEAQDFPKSGYLGNSPLLIPGRGGCGRLAWPGRGPGRLRARPPPGRAAGRSVPPGRY